MDQVKPVLKKGNRNTKI